MEFHELSYRMHEENYNSLVRGAERAQHAMTWRATDTVDAWRHHRMYRVLDPLIDEYKNSNWLTVGDGRFASDAHYLYSKGIDVTATDISDALLREAFEEGHIKQFKRENAEALTAQDGSYDFVFCKESFHHFPRPMLALYEMLRVCRKGVVLLEPNDVHLNTSIMIKIVKKVQKILFGQVPVLHRFEKGGNYVYSLSRREVEKVALGLNCRIVAFCGLNDCYIQGVEYERAEKNNEIYRKVKKVIQHHDRICRLGLADYVLLSSIIFKEDPSDECLVALKKAGYEIVRLPQNPYVSSHIAQSEKHAISS